MVTRLMFTGGGIAGLIGAMVVTSVPYRYIDGALVVPGLHVDGPARRPARPRPPAGRRRGRGLLRRPAGRRVRDGARDRGAPGAELDPAGDRHRDPRGDGGRHRPSRTRRTRHERRSAELIDLSLIPSILRALTPVLLAALGGAICAKAGVFNVGLEGFMLVGAFAAVAGQLVQRVGLGRRARRGPRRRRDGGPAGDRLRQVRRRRDHRRDRPEPAGGRVDRLPAADRVRPPGHLHRADPAGAADHRRPDTADLPGLAARAGSRASSCGGTSGASGCRASARRPRPPAAWASTPRSTATAPCSPAVCCAGSPVPSCPWATSSCSRRT